MAITVTFDDATRTGTVNYRDGVDNNGVAVTGTENLLLQLAIDRASANTARVSLMQVQLQDQSDKINTENSIMKKLLDHQPTDPSRTDSQSLTGVSFSADEVTLLQNLQDQNGSAISSYFSSLSAGGTPKLASGKSFNDVMTAMKSALNADTNLNQQTMINYQSLINQRDQMTEWVASLIMLLASTASATTNNLR